MTTPSLRRARRSGGRVRRQVQRGEPDEARQPLRDGHAARPVLAPRRRWWRPGLAALRPRHRLPKVGGTDAWPPRPMSRRANGACPGSQSRAKTPGSSPWPLSPFPCRLRPSLSRPLPPGPWTFPLSNGYTWYKPDGSQGSFYTLSFSVTFLNAGDTYRLAHAHPYTYSDHKRHLARLLLDDRTSR